MEWIVKAIDIEKSFVDESSSTELPVLKGLSFSIRPGERVAIMGPSGSGKSTLLNILGLLDVPTKGQLTFMGCSVESLSSSEMCRLRNHHLGFIFQLHHLLPQCTVLENILLPFLPRDTRAKKAGRDREEARRYIEASDLLKTLGLYDRKNSYPAALSPGERQRVAVARALITRPSLILADEPTGSLDEKNAQNLMDLLLGLADERGSAVVLVSHDRQIAEMRHGRII